MQSDEVIARWQAGGGSNSATPAAGCAIAVGDWGALERLERALAQTGVGAVGLNRELLHHLDDAAALTAEEAQPGAIRPRVRAALARALQAWLDGLEDDDAPLAVRDLELAVAERLDLTALRTVRRPLLLLLPGRREHDVIWLYASERDRGVRLDDPPAPSERVWDVTA